MIERLKVLAVWAVCILLVVGVLVGAFFLNSYRWGNCS